MTDGLPGSMVDIAEAVGLAVALKVMAHWGGLEVDFPKNPGPDHEVIKVLGETDGRALCHYLSGGRLSVPHPPSRSNRHRVAEAIERGLNRSETARQLQLTQRHVRRLANSRTSDHRQPDLFED